jgi:hypothetical protein
MTDLERDWDDLPVGAAPLDAILREGRREAARAARDPQRRLRRSLGVIAVAGGVAAAFVAGTLVTSPPTAPPPTAGPAPGDAVTPVAFFGELEAPASCDELLAHYVEQGVDAVTAYGWSGPAYGDFVLVDDLGVRGVDLFTGALDEAALPAVPTAGRAPMAQADAVTTRATSSATGTNVQEAGVDEPDTVKTDGELLVRLRGPLLTTYDVSGDEVEPLGELDLGDLEDGELLLAGDTVVAVGNDGTRARHSYGGHGAPSPQTRVLTVDVSDPATPALEQTVDYDAASVTARQHGDTVRLVLSAGLPELDFVQPGRRGGQQTALDTNRGLVEQTTITDWLPSVRVDGGETRPLLDCAEVAVPRADVALGTMAVVGFDATAPVDGLGDLDAFGVAGDASLAYESPDHLYLATPGGASCTFCRTAVGAVASGTTHVYDFALDGTRATYVGAGEVEGSVRDRWAMDEHDGVLRLAVGPSSETGNFNSVVTMRAEGDALVEIGRVDRLGVGEQITAVRWFDGLAIVVTFRQVDPLYAVDLTDQRSPTLLGELKIPGFSSYLHPLGSQRMVGLGEGPVPDGRGWGAQAGLFDVTDLTDPRRLDVLSYGRGSQALAGTDPRQLTWLPEERVVLTVVRRGRAAYVSALQVRDGALTDTSTRVEYGSDADEVRTVPLYGAGPDGTAKVVLVTGEDVEFLDVG